MSNSASSPTLINNSTPIESISRKRRRTEKTVRFDVEHTVIIDTYSSLDYDRGSIFSFPIQYKINPNILSPSKHKDIPILSLEIPPTPSSPCDSEASSPDIEQILPSAAPTDKKKKRPKLSINTALCSSDGPLFFTKLSTNHVKHRVNSAQDDEEDDDIMNDYLIPVTTPPTPY